MRMPSPGSIRPRNPTPNVMNGPTTGIANRMYYSI